MHASWHPTEAFGIHWDDHDTVVFQLEGAKRWNLYGATRADPLRLDVEAPEKPGGPPLAEVILQAGDMLYVPRGWWHAVAATQGRSLHLTCGLTPVTGHHLLVWLAGQLLPLLPPPPPTHPARERTHGGRPRRGRRVRRAAAQGSHRGAPPSRGR
ncbi:JmjC domain-containing protein [Streptomyces virginiae]|uniref:JmjC domain-containing protein n=1 Tax=Streptomyces virginiae TaxID=1961 RepID=UPI0036E50C0A